jgi:cell division protein FtsL
VNKKHKRRNSLRLIRLTIFFFLIIVLLIVHLIGKVNIDVVLIKNDELTVETQNLKKRIDELQVIINQKRAYKRIVSLARKQGLVFIPPTQIFELEVAMDSTIDKIGKPRNILSRLAQSD